MQGCRRAVTPHVGSIIVAWRKRIVFTIRTGALCKERKHCGGGVSGVTDSRGQGAAAKGIVRRDMPGLFMRELQFRPYAVAVKLLHIGFGEAMLRASGGKIIWGLERAHARVPCIIGLA